MIYYPLFLYALLRFDFLLFRWIGNRFRVCCVTCLGGKRWQERLRALKQRNRRFCDKHNFQKPNDDRALHLMNAAAKACPDPQEPFQHFRIRIALCSVRVTSAGGFGC